MRFLPLDRMLDRVNLAKENSDSEFFRNLLLAGEFLVKLVATGMTASIKEEPERYRYRLLYTLVRANGIGDWDQMINETLIGPTSQYICDEAHKEYEELTTKVTADSWQYKALEELHLCLKDMKLTEEKLPRKIEGRKWFSLFALLRNKTRGHGAELSQVHSRIANHLEQSLSLWYENFSLFERPWAHLHQNVSGKYRVTPLSHDVSKFDPLKKSIGSPKLVDGIYVYFDRPVFVEILQSDADATDFWIANGNLRKSTFELLSYITGDRKDVDASPYLTPTGALPKSETQGLPELDLIGESFTNLPPLPPDYVKRSQLEQELCKVITVVDQYPIITLVGRGGIGKTYLALRVLHSLANEGGFGAMFWFSARDIDLSVHGPKPVKPHILTKRDIARQYASLVKPEGGDSKSFDSIAYFQESLTNSQYPLAGSRIIFVFDNFETVENPVELFAWIDTYIRLPNKALITTRHREFKADYPVEVLGMLREEFDFLVGTTARRLGVHNLLTRQYQDNLYSESEGHPYVAKILLGEIAKARKLTKIDRILADREHILEALFERTYANLSSTARRVFLTMCNWRSPMIVQLALEAVLLRPINERMDVQKAIDELVQSSFIETSTLETEETTFLHVPLVAKLFGVRKLRVSPIRSAIEADSQLLQVFGATSTSAVQKGVTPRIQALFRFIEETLSKEEKSLDEWISIIEFVARKHQPAWLEIVKLYDLYAPANEWKKTEQALRKYLEYNPNNISVWHQLAHLYEKHGDEQAQINTLVSMCLEPNVPYPVLSDVANILNRMFKRHPSPLDSNEKRYIVRQLADLMQNRQDEADADDCSRLAWLFLHLRDEQKAQEVAERGLSIEPTNDHCLNILQRIRIG